MNRRTLWQLSLSLIVLGALPDRPAQAWNEFGHMVVAKLAYDRMDDGLKGRIAAILAAHPHYDEFLARNCPPAVPVAEWAFLRASIWPDWIRPRPKDPRGSRVTMYHRPVDHYINIPIIHPADQERFKNLQPDPDRHDALAAFRQRLTELTLEQTTTADKAVALCWILHIVGDIHQPLHAAALFAADFPEGDRGGNSFCVRIEGSVQRLHTFWDGALGAVPGRDDDGVERQARLYGKIRDTLQSLPRLGDASSHAADLANHTTFPSWADESHRWAKSVAYRNCEQRWKPAGTDGSLPVDAPPVDSQYAPAARELSQYRAQLAGHRLATKLAAALR